MTGMTGLSLFDLLKHNVVTNIGGMYLQRSETRDRLREQHQALFEAIIERRAEFVVHPSGISG